MQKPTVAVLFGSRSTEHDISIITALAAIIKPLELSQKYKVVPVYIAKDGRWYSDPRLTDITLYQSEALERFLAKQKPLALLFDNGLKLIKTNGLARQTINIDVAFPATHGTHGEDGELMGVLEMANVAYVGCDVPASVVAMDKVLAKQVAQAHNIPTPAFVSFTKQEYEGEPGVWLKRVAKLAYPLFVKPAHLGSSIGITRVSDKTELANAIEVALHYDTKALVEEAVPHLIEVTLPIMGNDDLTAALLEQPLLKSEDFFDFETKYMGNGGKKGGGKKANGTQGAQGYSQLPADLPDKLYARAQQTGLDVYRAIGCSGTARVDMLINNQTSTVYFNEVNPLPGSLYFHNWRQAGVSNVDLVDRLVTLAIQRHQSRTAQQTSFDTSFLAQF